MGDDRVGEESHQQGRAQPGERSEEVGRHAHGKQRLLTSAKFSPALARMAGCRRNGGNRLKRFFPPSAAFYFACAAIATCSFSSESSFLCFFVHHHCAVSAKTSAIKETIKKTPPPSCPMCRLLGKLHLWSPGKVSPGIRKQRGAPAHVMSPDFQIGLTKHCPDSFGVSPLPT